MIKLISFFVLAVLVVGYQLSNGKVFRRSGENYSRSSDWFFGIIFVAVNVLSIWAAVEVGARAINWVWPTEASQGSLGGQSPELTDPEITPEGNTPQTLFPQPPSDPWNFLEVRSKAYPVDTVQPNTHYVRRDINGQLNIRNGPGEEYRIVGKRDGGRCIRVINVQNGWATVAMPTASGAFAYYASASYLIPIQRGQRCE